ncbi:VOC family protein [Lipingzhangella sp. LS1_29]|uniref:VOC family protein n=1 Tax=Lipingzhangella rawalii TaxID=2055835 RepID=A0ABU2H7J4_9ACTN|nr:VOC family protein [Lipingzhangella rawalii]MDS1270825.1 VOC family protein [Lipingzhangella rawalii]
MVHVLSSRILLHPRDPERSRHFYGEILGLSVFREFGTGPGRGTVYFLGGGFLELSRSSDRGPEPGATQLWIQVPDLDQAHRELVQRGAPITREPRREPWGLDEMWTADPDGLPICVVEVPSDHPMRYRPGTGSSRAAASS